MGTYTASKKTTNFQNPLFSIFFKLTPPPKKQQISKIPCFPFFLTYTASKKTTNFQNPLFSIFFFNLHRLQKNNKFPKSLVFHFFSLTPPPKKQQISKIPSFPFSFLTYTASKKTTNFQNPLFSIFFFNLHRLQKNTKFPKSLV